MTTPQLSDESIEELRGILKSDTGIDVSYKAARLLGEFLIQLYSHLTK